jgi:asparagine synthase (glutamine-hydrolysing)
MMADVPFGVFLSGGIDSSTNVALMSELMDRPVDTFTVGFRDHRHLNELEEARLVARHFRANHHEILIDESDMRSYLDSLVYHQDEPIADWVCIPLYFVSKLARDSGVTVVQVGEGSDEQFCGYNSYMGYLDLYRRYWKPFQRVIPSAMQRFFAAMARYAAQYRPSLDVYADIIDRASRNREHFWSGATVFWELTKRRLVDYAALQSSTEGAMLADFCPPGLGDFDSFRLIESFQKNLRATAPDADVLTRMIYNEFKLRLPELLLMRVDKISMSTSLEARVPFLDHKLVELSMDIPMQWKVKNGIPKYLLKKAVTGLIPDEIITRKKMGFGAPMSQWMRGDFGSFVKSTLLKSKLLNRGFLNKDYIIGLIEENQSGRRDNSLYLWTLFNLTAWYDRWIEAPAPAGYAGSDRLKCAL